jgi:hypothetical protein
MIIHKHKRLLCDIHGAIRRSAMVKINKRNVNAVAGKRLVGWRVRVMRGSRSKNALIDFLPKSIHFTATLPPSSSSSTLLLLLLLLLLLPANLEPFKISCLLIWGHAMFPHTIYSLAAHPLPLRRHRPLRNRCEQKKDEAEWRSEDIK